MRKPGGSSPFADTVTYDGLRYTVGSPGPTDNSDFGSAVGGGRTPFRDVCITIADPGTYALEFLVADQGDTAFDSGLLIDDVRVGTACNPTIQITDSDQSALEVKGGTLVFSTVTNKRVTTSTDAATLTFASNGDYTGDNPNLQEQVWVATRNGPAFDIARVTTAVGAEFGDPRISANGQWLVFPSTGDLVPPGNPDGNFEIFRFDRTGGTLQQITGTTGCSNDDATINDDGSRIAFVSDCGFGISASGDEIVYWDGTFRGVDTTGCQSRDPRLSRDVDGRYVSFSSNADHEPGQNPGGARVVFRYDRMTGSSVQLATPDPLKLFTVSAIDDTGSWVAAERIDLLTGAFDIVLFDATTPGTEFSVATGGPTVSNNFPAVGIDGNRPLVVFQSNDPGGNNPDANTESWAAGAVFDAPDPVVYCSTPGLAIPDNDNTGVSDVITIADSCTVFQWAGWAAPIGGDAVDLEVLLYHESLEIVVQIRPGASMSNAGTIGIQNRDATNATQYRPGLDLTADTAVCFFEPRYPPGGPVADLEITKTHKVEGGVAAGSVSYTIGVLNRGPSPSTGAQVTDAVPPGLIGCSWTCTASDGSFCTPAGTGAIDETVDLQPAGWVDYLLVCAIDSTGADIVNTATVTAPGSVTDLEPGNNAALDVLTTVAGDVADDLRLAHDDGELLLTWGVSCLGTDVDYAVYEGVLGAFDSHLPLACGTNGATAVSRDVGSGDTYYLVVPTNLGFEGSYGVATGDFERAQSTSACLPRSIAGCR